MRSTKIIWLIVVLIGLVPGSATTHAASTKSLRNLSSSFQELSQRVTPAVVQIFVTGYGTVAEAGLPGSFSISKQRGSGSGIVVDPSGYIVTNAHVVDGAHRIRVRFRFTPEEPAKKESILMGMGQLAEAQIVGIDRETDVAVLKVEGKDLPVLQLTDSDELQQGEIVLAFGSPLGLSNSVSMGVVSSVARQLQPEAPVVYIQTDATINPGNSGGPLVNADGRVVGINTLIFSQSGGSEGIGFAIPSNIVKNVLEQIRSTGHVRRGQIGINAQTISPVLARGLGLAQNEGVILGDVNPGGPADTAGLQVGDVILTLDGKIMENARQLDVNLYRRHVGELVKIEYLRAGEKKAVDVSVVVPPDDPGHLVDLVRPDTNLIRALGILALDIDQRAAAMLPQLRSRLGVVVAARDANGPIWRNAFQPGDVIYAINGQPTRSLIVLQTVAEELSTGDAVVMQVQRGAELQYISFEID